MPTPMHIACHLKNIDGFIDLAPKSNIAGVGDCALQASSWITNDPAASRGDITKACIRGRVVARLPSTKEHSG